jgi:cation diffusion facilitator family transporter
MARILSRSGRRAGAVIPTQPLPPARTGAALLSVVSNSTLILLKFVAGALTGSVAILTEALHSSIDLIASVVALFSVRKAGAPADEDHRYGHEKIENLAAAIEGMLILVGSGVIVFEAIRHLVSNTRIDTLGVGIGVIAFSAVANLAVSTFIARRGRQTDSAALEADAAHLRTDAFTSAGVLVGLVLVQVTGENWIDPVVALLVAIAIVGSGLRIISRSSRVLVDETLPPDELEAIRGAVLGFGSHGIAGFHKLRTRRAGMQRYVDMHVQFRAGTTLEDAHRAAHELQDEIAKRLRGADVLIHLEPEDRVRPGEEVGVRAEGSETAH